jgi:hypothetical protein
VKRTIIAAVAVATTLALAGPVLTSVRNNSLPRRFKFAAVEEPPLCWFFKGRWTKDRPEVPWLDRFTGRVRCVGRACVGRKAATNLNFGPDYFAGYFEGPIKFRNNTFCRFVQSAPGDTHYNCWYNKPGSPSAGEGSFRIELPPTTRCGR